MLPLLAHWLILTVVIFLTFTLVPGLEAKKKSTYFWVALVYSILNAIVWGVFGGFLKLVSVITLGLIGWLVNSFVLYLTDVLITDFKAKNPGSIFIGALLIWFFSLLLRSLIL
ncbi:MAG: phage holin family protein [Acidobacteria bacterium]|nr:phage holin family protein [Acidobacteriota bacterium]